jgi:hypothetical protein
LFANTVPRKFGFDLMLNVVRQYRDTRAQCEREFERHEAHDVMSTLRRAKIEGAMRVSAAAYPEIKVKVRKNATGGANYTELRVGPFVLTQSAVEAAVEVPREATFRKAYAAKTLLLPGIRPDAPRVRARTRQICSL